MFACPSGGRVLSLGELGALQKKRLGVPLHIVTDSKLVFLRLKEKCEKCKRHKWVGPLSHVDLWSKLWDWWLLLGDSASSGHHCM